MSDTLDRRIARLEQQRKPESIRQPTPTWRTLLEAMPPPGPGPDWAALTKRLANEDHRPIPSPPCPRNRH